MSYTQDKAHSSAMLGAILDGEKAQQQQQPQPQTSSDSASIFSTSSFGSAKALLKKHSKNKSSKPSKKDSSGSGSGSGSSPTEAELSRIAQRNQVRMGGDLRESWRRMDVVPVNNPIGARLIDRSILSINWGEVCPSFHADNITAIASIRAGPKGLFGLDYGGKDPARLWRLWIYGWYT
ncbi:hypothetical protein F4781DRAFT_427864 [Annulohypoxylon bovei var. microspora]|nr:hypothetical protein F4781DRAFT_427864 [Annulohypoxylon bovei var. microspora]